jgi:hypothetical protein
LGTIDCSSSNYKKFGDSPVLKKFQNYFPAKLNQLTMNTQFNRRRFIQVITPGMLGLSTALALGSCNQNQTAETLSTTDTASSTNAASK